MVAYLAIANLFWLWISICRWVSVKSQYLVWSLYLFWITDGYTIHPPTESIKTNKPSKVKKWPKLIFLIFRVNIRQPYIWHSQIHSSYCHFFTWFSRNWLLNNQFSAIASLESGLEIINMAVVQEQLTLSRFHAEINLHYIFVVLHF